MGTNRLLGWTLTVVLLAPSVTTAAGKKYALLIGVTEYKHASLPALRFTENDAEELAKALRQNGAGFTSIRVLTVTRGKADAKEMPIAANIRKALNELIANKGRHDTILVAFAGHGVELAVSDPDEKGPEKSFPYLCPSDADLAGVSYSTGRSATLINVDEFFKDLGKCGAGSRLVLLDACRNEIDADSATRNVDVKKMTIPRGVGALFSCAPGERAWETNKLDKKKGHGVFFYHVIQGLKGAAKNEDSEVGWDELTSYVRRNVAKKVPVIIGGGAKQTPHAVTNLVGSPVLVGKPSGDELFKKGMDLLQGITVERNPKEAFKCFEKAAETEHLLARATLVWMYDWGPGVGGRNFAKAKEMAMPVIADLKTAAEEGNADAQYLIGRFYKTGLGVDQSFVQMVVWYRKAIDQGNIPAMIELGLAYKHGAGSAVSKDLDESLNLFRKAAKAGSCLAMQFVADAYFEGAGIEKDLAEAAKWHRKAADKGSEGSQTQLGYMYDNGVGVERNLDEAFKLYGKGAKNGQAVAMSNLGNCYEFGRGVEKDQEKAFEWYLKAAEKGFWTAQYRTGIRYLDGNGVSDSREQAIFWLRKAAAQGHMQAKEKLAELEK